MLISEAFDAQQLVLSHLDFVSGSKLLAILHAEFRVDLAQQRGGCRVGYPHLLGQSRRGVSLISPLGDFEVLACQILNPHLTILTATWDQRSPCGRTEQR